MSRNEWSGLWERVQHRLIRVLDIVSILLFDAVILAMGYGCTWLLDRFIEPGNGLFQTARKMSGGIFLILYAVVAVYDLWELLRSQSESTKS